MKVEEVEMTGFRWTCPKCSRTLEFLSRGQLVNNARMHKLGHEHAAKRKAKKKR